MNEYSQEVRVACPGVATCCALHCSPFEVLGGEHEQVGHAARVLHENDRRAVQHSFARRVERSGPSLHHHTAQLDALLLCTAPITLRIQYRTCICTTCRCIPQSLIAY